MLGGLDFSERTIKERSLRKLLQVNAIFPAIFDGQQGNTEERNLCGAKTLFSALVFKPKLPDKVFNFMLMLSFNETLFNTILQ